MSVGADGHDRLEVVVGNVFGESGILLGIVVAGINDDAFTAFV